jgi:hypothetical protein
MKIKAQIVKKAENAKRPDNKELVSAYSLVVRLPSGEMREVVTVKCYMGRSASASVVHAVLWVRCKDGEWTSGSGSAGGYGYHKESAAIADAVKSAGIELKDLDRTDDAKHLPRHYFDFGGTGESYYPQVFDAIARAAGYRGRTLFLSH